MSCVGNTRKSRHLRWVFWVCSVENLVENEREKKAQATNKIVGAWALLTNSFAYVIDCTLLSTRSGFDRARYCSEDASFQNLHRNVAFSRVRGYQIKELCLNEKTLLFPVANDLLALNR
jgi:hypothetical protein